jgi:prolyl oligopeptidase
MPLSLVGQSMRALVLGVAALAAGHSLVAQATGAVGPAGASGAANHFPATMRGGQADDLNGIKVSDPYRWLEAVHSPAVQAWVAGQNAFTEAHLAQLPQRKAVIAQVARSWAYPKLSAPFTAGDRRFFYENSGLENQSVLYVQDRTDALPHVLIDPYSFSKDGLIPIVDQSPSADGRYLAYAVALHGGSARSVRIRDVRTGQDVGDELSGIKAGPLAWTHDGRGFFYVRSDLVQPAAASNPLAPEGRQRVFYHRIGRSQSDDKLVYENPDHPEWRLRADISDDGQYLVLTLRAGTDLRNRLYVIDLDNPRHPNLGAPLVKLFDAGDALYDFVANQGPVFYLRTSRGAPRNRLVAVDINIPDANRWTPIIPETYDPLIDVRRVDDRFVAHHLHDAHSVLDLVSLDGGVRGTVELPGIGTVVELNANGDGREFFFTFTSFLQPPAIYRYDLETRAATPYKEPRTEDLGARFETTQLFYTSKDGTRVPMFITAKRGLTLDGTHAALLSGIGSMNESATPVFSPEVVAWLELGGIYAVANVRGGGEYGRAWHEAASGPHKQVAVDDFIAAAEFLVSQRYTRPSSLGIFGRGFGGVLVGAAMTQRPELFGAVVADAGLFDLARFPRFTVGATWTPEFGSPDRPADLRALLGYSPLQNVRPSVHYPPTLITAGESDDVIAAAHSYKFVAALQAAQAGEGLVLLRAEPGVGNGALIPTAKQMAASADRLTFLVNALRK